MPLTWKVRPCPPGSRFYHPCLLCITMFGGVYECLSTSVQSLPRVFYTMCRPSLPVLLWDFPSRPFIPQAQIKPSSPCRQASASSFFSSPLLFITLVSILLPRRKGPNQTIMVDTVFNLVSTTDQAKAVTSSMVTPQVSRMDSYQ